MCAPPDSGHIHMVIAASTLLDRRHDLRQFECNVTHQAAQVTQKYVPACKFVEMCLVPLTTQKIQVFVIIIIDKNTRICCAHNNPELCLLACRVSN